MTNTKRISIPVGTKVRAYGLDAVGTVIQKSPEPVTRRYTAFNAEYAQYDASLVKFGSNQSESMWLSDNDLTAVRS